MSDLFDSGDDEVGAMTEAPPEMASAEQVRLLESYGYRKEATRKWTQEKADTVIRKNRREERIALDRAKRTAQEIDDAVPRGQPSVLERTTAADYVEQSQANGSDELLMAVMYSIWVCTDDELKRLAAYLVLLWRAQA